MAMKVVITDYEYEEVNQERSLITGAGFDLYDYHYLDEENVIRVARDADALIVQYASLTAKIIEQLEKCRIIVRYGIGYDNIDISAAAAKNIVVCNVPDYGIDEVSNHAIAMLLALARRLPVLHRSMENGSWGYLPQNPAYRVAGSVLGLAGFGRIARSVAAKMKPFGVRILAFDPYIKPETASELGVELVDFDTLCAESDYISVHCPLSDDTDGLFGRSAFKKMKNSAILINTSRGSVIRQNELIEALQNKEIAALGIDVYDREPLDKDSPLRTMPNVICTPHSAWYSEESIKALQRKAAEEVIRVLQGGRPSNPVNM